MTKMLQGRATRGVESRFRFNQQVKKKQKERLGIVSKTELYPHISKVSL